MKKRRPSPQQLDLFVDVPARVAPAATRDNLTLQEKYDLALKKVARWTRGAALPGLSPGAREFSIQMRRSCLAELICRQKALAYAKPHSDPEVEKRWALYRMFRMPLPTPPPREDLR